MKISKKYKKYRKAGIELNKKITERAFNGDTLDDTVNLLGFDRQGQPLYLMASLKWNLMNFRKC